MPQQSEAKFLAELTEVPAGWPLATVIDAFLDLAAYDYANRAREAVSFRLVELWASQPEEAEAWLERCRERFAKHLVDKATRREKLCEALLRHGAAEWGKYKHAWHCWGFSEAGLLRELRPAAEQESKAARYLQQPDSRPRCRELAERLVAAESTETARKRQKLEEETAERRRLEAELQKSQQEECRELSNRLAAAEAEVSSKDAELQTSQEECRGLRNRLAAAESQVRSAQTESATLKEQCEELATRAAATESAVTEMRQELQMAQDEHGKCQERCEELVARLEAEVSEHAKTKERLVLAESDAEKRVEVERPSSQERFQQAEVARSVLTASNKVELLLENVRFQERCDQFRQQLSTAEAERSAMLGQMQVLWEEKGMYKERIRELERHLQNAKKSHHRTSGHNPLSEAPGDEASDGRQSDLAEQLGYSFVDDDGILFGLKPLLLVLGEAGLRETSLLHGRCHLQDTELRHRLLLDGARPQERLAGAGRG